MKFLINWMLRLGAFALLFSAALPTHAQKGCMRQLMNELSSMHAMVFMPESLVDSFQMRMSQRGRGGPGFYEGAEATWHNALLTENMDQVIALSPATNASNPCSRRWEQTLNRMNMLILVPTEYQREAEGLGFQAVPSHSGQQLAGNQNEWRKLLNSLLNTLQEENPLGLDINLDPFLGAAATSNTWYQTPMPLDFQETGGESISLNGVVYRRMKVGR